MSSQAAQLLHHRQQMAQLGHAQAEIKGQQNNGKRPSETAGSNNVKRKPTDRNLPSKIESIIPEAKLYTQLQAQERKLDALVTRKRLDLQDALAKPSYTKKTLRIFVSNSATDQPYMIDQSLTSSGVPSWILKVEGRIVDSTGKLIPDQPKFSSFIHSMNIELDRDPMLYSEGNKIEWSKPSSGQETDGFEIKRRGDTDVRAKIELTLNNPAETYKLSKALAQLLGFETGSQSTVIMGLWQYIKFNSLQDPQEKHFINNDEHLRNIFYMPKMAFPQIPDLVKRHLFPLDPIIIEYTIRIDQPEFRPNQAYDIQVDVPDEYRAKLENMLSNTESQKEIVALDEKIVQCVHALHNANIKRDFFFGFSSKPTEFFESWIGSQTKDLETILGDSYSLELDDPRKTDLFSKPWINEAVFHYLSTKSQNQPMEPPRPSGY
ncbi:SWI/SNF and RSC complex subunit Ssr3 [Basidiobolus ranarum]|uniref:SWI/SNF and RSC complex subunit Ssr3 n=1 Tax=Basidiobolus ranarum TaxID=34480 RepID=A0ABR2VNR4_9FUNG